MSQIADMTEDCMGRRTTALYALLRERQRETRQAKRITIVLGVVNLVILARLVVGGMP